MNKNIHWLAFIFLFLLGVIYNFFNKNETAFIFVLMSIIPIIVKYSKEFKEIVFNFNGIKLTRMIKETEVKIEHFNSLVALTVDEFIKIYKYKYLYEYPVFQEEMEANFKSVLNLLPDDANNKDLRKKYEDEWKKSVLKRYLEIIHFYCRLGYEYNPAIKNVIKHSYESLPPEAIPINEILTKKSAGDDENIRKWLDSYKHYFYYQKHDSLELIRELSKTYYHAQKGAYFR